MRCAMLRLAILSTTLSTAASFLLPRYSTASMWSRSQNRRRADFTKVAAFATSPEYAIFKAQIEQRLIERFGKDESGLSRLLEYWRESNNRTVPDAFVGDPTMTDPTKSNCVQCRDSYFAGLTAREFWDPTEYAWCQELKANYQAIRDEFFAVVAEGSQEFEDAVD
jgi:hypothetical protein